MIRIHPAFLCAVVMVIMMITAGCTSSGAPPLIAPETTTAATPVQNAPVVAATSQPGATGTEAPGTCTANTKNDPANCGQCGYACPANALCQAGQCYCKDGFTAENNHCVVLLAGTSSGNGCPAGMSPCSGNCYDLAASSANCGMCGNVCPTGMICSASTCTNSVTAATTAPTTTATATTTTFSLGNSGTQFNPGLSKACFLGGGTICDGTCVNISTSNGNCGTCGHSCSGLTATCCGGTCTNLKTDRHNCGTCGYRCISFVEMCEGGHCMLTEQSP